METFNNGLLIQWGKISAINVPAYKDTVTYVTLPYTHTKFYKVVVSQHDGLAYWANITTQLINVGLSSFGIDYYNTIANVTATNIQSFWISVGV